MYDISSIKVDPEGVAVRLGWTYTTEDGSIWGTHVLLTPPGEADLEEASKEDILGWLTSQLQNTEEDFIDAIAKQASAKASEDSLTSFPVPE